MKKPITFLFTFTILTFIFAKQALAVCPICTLAVAGGLGLSRYLGIDDSISGLWVGGLILSSSFWLSDWLNKKKFKFLSKVSLNNLIILSSIIMYAVVLIPLYLGGIIGHPFNKILGIDKLIFGTAIGSIFFLFAIWLDKKVRKIKGHQLFNYQKVAFPVTTLVIVSIILYFVIK
jgi:hypothetical protein